MRELKIEIGLCCEPVAVNAAVRFDRTLQIRFHRRVSQEFRLVGQADRRWRGAPLRVNQSVILPDVIRSQSFQCGHVNRHCWKPRHC